MNLDCLRNMEVEKDKMIGGKKLNVFFMQVVFFFFYEKNVLVLQLRLQLGIFK